MSRMLTTCALVALLILAALPALAGEPAPQSVVAFAHGKLADYGHDPVIVAAVKAANAEGRTLDQIQARDAEWRGTAGLDDGMKAIMDSACGRHLAQLVEENAWFAEIFVMDNQGANVAMSDKTSDYWQGDEAKFQKSFAAGQGAVFIDEVEFDDSAQVYQVQVSVPVFDGDTVIGAITFGVDVDAVEQSGV